jgi:hypothetical protein
MAYAEVDLETGHVALVQAGHPHPAILRADGTVDYLGEGGMPVGLIGAAGYDRIEAQLSPGDRLFLMSDGITECADPSGVELGEQGLARILRQNARLTSPGLMDALVAELQRHAGGDDPAHHQWRSGHGKQSDHRRRRHGGHHHPPPALGQHCGHDAGAQRRPPSGLWYSQRHA